MRDLYRLLGVNATASDAAIRTAISRCANDSVRKDASEVLLNGSSRKAYDRLYLLLNDIGQLRANMGITHGAHWDEPDFTRTPTKTVGAREAFFQKFQQANANHRSAERRENGDFMRVVISSLGAALILGALFVVFTDDKRTHKTSNLAPPQPVVATQRASTLTPEPLPAHGKTWVHTNGARIAPLGIETTGSSHYFVKLVDAVTGAEVIELFVRGGSSLTVDVPVGRYRIRYATGETWYGLKNLFGPSTGYSEAERDFEFEKTARGVSGFTITLYRVAHGNLQTKALSPAAF